MSIDLKKPTFRGRQAARRFIPALSLIFGCVSTTHAGVFEESQSGGFVRIDTPGSSGLSLPGTNPSTNRTDPPKSLIDIPYDENRTLTPSIATSESQRAIAARLPKLSLPAPRTYRSPLSVDQKAMHSLSTAVGRNFASDPAIRRSHLNEEVFVNLFTAMIQRESNFDPRAVSPVGAMGLGQLMPSTASDLGVTNPFSARQNLQGAGTYLTKMLDEFGSPELALAAYNAGPGAVRKYGGIPPYKETKQYVSDILHAVSSTASSATDQAVGEDKLSDVLAFADETRPEADGNQPFKALVVPQKATGEKDPVVKQKKVTRPKKIKSHRRSRAKSGAKDPPTLAEWLDRSKPSKGKQKLRQQNKSTRKK